jgi:hypothetical protein
MDERISQFCSQHGHRVVINKNGRTYVAAMGEQLPTFLII